MSLDALKSKARQAILNGKYEVALKHYTDIHQEAPSDLRMFTRLAEMKEKTGNVKGAVSDYTKIAKQYADDGFVVQAIAINKLILRLDSEQTAIKKRLRDLSSERGEDWALSTIISSDISQLNKPKSHRTPLLSGLSGQELDDFIDSLELREFSAGEFIYHKGDRGDLLYIIGLGMVYLETEDTRGNKKVFSKLAEGDFFGELAFMSQQNHVDSAIAKSDGNVLLLNRKNFDNWVEKYPSIHQTVEDFYRQRVLARILAMTPVFEKIPTEARISLAEQFSSAYFTTGDTIIKEGDVGNTFFLIRSGKVKVVTVNKKDTSKVIVLGTLSEGSFFGEVSMLTNMPRTATITAIGDVELMVLTSDKFLNIAKQYPTVKQVVEVYLKQRVQNTIKKMHA
ncbi:MAG: cyclic nucleotide-binding domain-containing protein [Ghiorsea sp.]|nr:cyclic nucleotide-binding domain-containing protein [Ghiorsea sp.]